MQLVQDAEVTVLARKCKEFYFVQNAIFQDKMTKKQQKKKTANFASNRSHW